VNNKALCNFNRINFHHEKKIQNFDILIETEPLKQCLFLDRHFWVRDTQFVNKFSVSGLKNYKLFCFVVANFCFQASQYIGQDKRYKFLLSYMFSVTIIFNFEMKDSRKFGINSKINVTITSVTQLPGHFRDQMTTHPRSSGNHSSGWCQPRCNTLLCPDHL
jgi:hypothetical protein